MKRKEFEEKIEPLQDELAVLQEWVVARGRRIAVVFEGRDTAGKGGTIKRIVEGLNPRVIRIAALPTPTEREQSQWYFQRYVPHLPAAGEIVLFDRSWYNRAGVEPVLGFCTPEQHEQFLAQCPAFERMLIDDGITLVKYWLDVGAKEQRGRLQERLDEHTKRWKIGAIDLKAQSHYYDYSRARDTMIERTSTSEAPWYVVDFDDQRTGQLNCIAHLLDLIPYEQVPHENLKLPKLQARGKYTEPDRSGWNLVPERYSDAT